ncbi:MAG: crossover junction endodeoxyribonuclease RuvC [Bacillota bacterium]|nr:crossover junction endodeoxyribonuclease RuvC [Bacillota bacterium]
MIIIGIDPSLTSTGICVMSEHGQVIESQAIQPKNKGPERLALFRQSLVNLISLRSNVHAFIEGYAFGANNQREALGELGGVLRLTLYDQNANMVIIQPTALKKFATGKGNADKIAMAVALEKQFQLEYPTSDQTDAFWLATFGRSYLGLMPNLAKERLEIIDGIKNPKVKKKKAKKDE